MSTRRTYIQLRRKKGTAGGSASSSKFAGTCVDDATVGTIAWVNVANAQGACDGVRASNTDSVTKNQTVCVVDTGHYLKSTNFGFAIPAGATITGIEVTVRRDSSSALFCIDGCGCGNTVDNSVKIVQGGVIAGTEKADTITYWPAPLTDKTYGGAADLWGLAWTVAQINAANFGLVVSPKMKHAADGSTGHSQRGNIDCVKITVYYTTAGVSHKETRIPDRLAIAYA